MYLVFTDLDGTLLDNETYSWEAARPALERLKQQGVPWIFVTSKTRAEVELWRRAMDNRHPFIVENGGAAFLPAEDGYQVLEWGTPYHELVDSLQRASQASGCRVRGVHEMTPEEMAAESRLPLEQAALAKQREYDEPFLILDPDRAAALFAAIEEQGQHWTRGGRFWHILGANDKALAVASVRESFEKTHGPAITVGLGDAANDVPFLNLMTVPVIVRSPSAEDLTTMAPRSLVTARSGPAGWNDAILSIIPG